MRLEERRLPLDWRERAPTQALGSRVSRPCPLERVDLLLPTFEDQVIV
jgi:hypothetical protein